MGDEPDDVDDAPSSEAGDLERIVEAAWQVLEASGYDNLKIQAVIRLSGLSTGRFYRHVSGKDELVATIVLQELRRATSILEQETRAGSPEERVRRWIDLVVSLAFGRRTGPRARFFTSIPHEVRELLDASRSDDADTSAPLLAAILEGQRLGVFPESDPVPDARMILGLCSRIDEVGGQSVPGDRAATVEQVADFVLAALTSDRPRSSTSG